MPSALVIAYLLAALRVLRPFAIQNDMGHHCLFSCHYLNYPIISPAWVMAASLFGLDNKTLGNLSNREIVFTKFAEWVTLFLCSLKGGQMEFCLPQFEVKVYVSFTAVNAVFATQDRSGDSDLCMFWCERWEKTSKLYSVKWLGTKW